MVHPLLAAWRVSLHRTRTDWPIVVAAALVTLLAATLLAAGPIYSSAVSEAGLHRTLASAPIKAANVEVVARAAPATAEAADATIRALVDETFAPAGVEVVTAATSDTFALPGQPDGEIRDLATLGFQDGLEAHAALLAGAWPAPAADGAPIELAILDATAATLDLAVGDGLSLTSRTNASLTVEAVVTAIYRPSDSADAFWWGDAARLDGVVETDQYRTFGPLLTARSDLLSRASGSSVLLTWHAFPAFDTIRIDGLAALRSRIEQLPARVDESAAGGFSNTATDLPALLTRAERSLLASRTGVLLLLAQLGILAGYAIALTADLIVDHRRIDTALLRSRGASATQVGLLAFAEAVLLAVPAALAGPWLASLALGLFNVGGPLAAIALRIDPRVSPDAFLAAGAAALGCALLLVLPAFGAARAYATEDSGRSRPGTRPLGQRLGLDVALLTITGIALWQLRLYGSPLTQTIQGSIGLDPLLVAAPAIGILAGSVVALRIVPLLALLADRLTARSRRLLGSLGARQLSRRPLRYTRTALLLMLAVSMGVFSVAYGSTWSRSQGDQADFQVGADVRVTPAARLDSLPGWAIEAAYRSIDGLVAAMPVARTSLRVARTAPEGELIGIDATNADIVVLRDPSERATVDQLAKDLVAARPVVPAMALPGRPDRIALSASLHIDAAAAVEIDPPTGTVTLRPIDPGAIAAAATAVPFATIRDARGLLHRFTGPEASIGPGGWQFVVPLDAPTEARRATIERLGGALTYPLELVGVDLEVRLPRNTAATDGSFALDGVAVAEGIDEPPGTSGWQTLDMAAPGPWSLGWIESGFSLQTSAETLADGVGIRFGGQDASVGPLPGIDGVRRGVTITFLPTAIADLARVDLPAIVNQPFLAALGAKPGDRVLTSLPGGARRLLVVGVVDAFPSVDPARPAAIVDLASLAIIRFGSAATTQSTDEWWLQFASPDAAAAAVASARTGGPLAGAAVTAREATRERLSTDPIALATIGTLALGFVVAGLFAVIGLAVSAAVSARQRRTEFALLRALGLSPDQLSRWLLLENGSLVLVSVAAGAGLGLVIAWVVLPFITVTQGGAVPFPPVVVDVPWPSILALVLVSFVALAATLAVLARWLRRQGVGSVLRMGEE